MTNESADSGTATADAGQGSSSDSEGPPEPASHSPRGAASITVEDASGPRPGERDTGLELDWIRERLADALALIDRPARRVDVAIVSDERMRELHGIHRGDPTTTDVITFDLSGDDAIEASIVTCVDEARRQAAARGHAVERELLLYILHGVLHCAGHDDRGDEAFGAMHAEEDRILEAIGVGATFGADPEPPS